MSCKNDEYAFYGKRGYFKLFWKMEQEIAHTSYHLGMILTKLQKRKDQCDRKKLFIDFNKQCNHIIKNSVINSEIIVKSQAKLMNTVLEVKPYKQMCTRAQCVTQVFYQNFLPGTEAKSKRDKKECFL